MIDAIFLHYRKLVQLLSKGCTEIMLFHELPTPILAFRILPTNEDESLEEYYSGEEHTHYSFHLLRAPRGGNLHGLVCENYVSYDNYRINCLRGDDKILSSHEAFNENRNENESICRSNRGGLLSYIMLGCESENIIHNNLYWCLRSAAVTSLMATNRGSSRISVGITKEFVSNESFYLIQALMVLVARIVWRRSGEELRSCIRNEKYLRLIFSPFSDAIDAHDDLAAMWAIILQGCRCLLQLQRKGRGKGSKRAMNGSITLEMVGGTSQLENRNLSYEGARRHDSSFTSLRRLITPVKNERTGTNQTEPSDDVFLLTMSDTSLVNGDLTDAHHAACRDLEVKSNSPERSGDTFPIAGSGSDFGASNTTWRDVVSSRSLLTAHAVHLLCGGISADIRKYQKCGIREGVRECTERKEEEEEKENIDHDTTFLSRIFIARKYLKASEVSALDELMTSRELQLSHSADPDIGDSGKIESITAIDGRDGKMNIRSESKSGSKSDRKMGLQSLAEQGVLLNAIREAVKESKSHFRISEPHERKNEHLRSALRRTLGGNGKDACYGDRNRELLGVDTVRVAYYDNVLSSRSNDDNNDTQCASKTVPLCGTKNTPVSASAIDNTTSDCNLALCYADRPSIHSQTTSENMESQPRMNENMHAITNAKVNANAATNVHRVKLEGAIPVVADASQKVNGIVIDLETESKGDSSRPPLINDKEPRRIQECKDIAGMMSKGESAAAALNIPLSATIDDCLSSSLFPMPVIWPVSCPLNPSGAELTGLDIDKVRTSRKNRKRRNTEERAWNPF